MDVFIERMRPYVYSARQMLDETGKDTDVYGQILDIMKEISVAVSWYRNGVEDTLKSGTYEETLSGGTAPIYTSTGKVESSTTPKSATEETQTAVEAKEKPKNGRRRRKNT